MERWSDVIGYEGLYEVSDLGEVRSKEGKSTNSTIHGVRVWKQRVLKQKTDKKGYKRVTLYKDKKATDHLVHRLVAHVYCENPNNDRLINHKDCKTSNNYYKNLEWCNYSQNLIHAYENGLNKLPIEVVLIQKNTKEEHHFRSMTKASKFLNRNHGAVSTHLKLGKNEIDGYEIKIKKRERGTIENH